MDTLQAFIIIGVAALIHASFQLSVSVLTLLSSHTLGKKRSHKMLLRLMSRFVLGAFLMTLLISSSTVFLASNLFANTQVFPVVWAGVCGLLMGLSVSVWLFYYRTGPATELWLPRGLVQYLHDRVKATSKASEAFSLGLSSVLAEIVFIIGPVFVVALTLIQLSPLWQLVGVGLYTAIASLPLMIIAGLIAGGHSIATIQKWRENNKRFLQFTAGSGLLILGFYLYVSQISVILEGSGIYYGG